MQNIGESPGNGHAEERHRKDEEMNKEDEEEVGDPDTLAIVDRVVWVAVTVCHTNIHSACLITCPSPRDTSIS